jgi:hypothetical protein
VDRSTLWTRANIDDLPFDPLVIARGLIIYTLHIGTFIFMYRAGTVRTQEIKCRLHGRE